MNKTDQLVKDKCSDIDARPFSRAAWIGLGAFFLLPAAGIFGKFAIDGISKQQTLTFAYNLQNWAGTSLEVVCLSIMGAYVATTRVLSFFIPRFKDVTGKTALYDVCSIGLDAVKFTCLVLFPLLFLWWGFNRSHAVNASYLPGIIFVLICIPLLHRENRKPRSSYCSAPEVEAYREKVERKQQRDAAIAERRNSSGAGAWPKANFASLSGNNELKKKLSRAVEQILAPAKPGHASRNGIFMYGEPGNGKTVFAEAIAGEYGLPLFTLTYGEVVSQWMGEMPMKIRHKFEEVVANSPCVFFIDEMDSFITSRSSINSDYEPREGSGNGSKEQKDIVNMFLTFLVDVRKHNVIVVAASNYMDRLDPAAIREGRFDFKIEITPPDQEARVGLLKSGLTKYASKVSVSEEVIQSVAKRWNGYSVKRILAVTEEMPSYLEDMTEKGQRRTALDFDDFMAALRRIQGSKGAQPEDVKPMSEMILPPATLDAVNMIAGRLRDPQRTEALGGSLPTGVLFYGPPGTGKTAVCKALAKEVGYAFLVSTGSDLARDPKAVEKLYAQGKELRPAIIFIDEADDLVRSREYSASTEATNKLLTVMDGIKDRVKDVIWVAATNHIDQVDSALLRGGRFTEKVPFFKPEEHQIEKHVGGWLDKRKLVLESDLTVREISLAIGEQSIANVEAVLQYAVNRAIGRAHGDQVVLKREDVRAALSVVLQTAG